MADNIQVMVRIRPFNSREVSDGAKTCVWVAEENPRLIVLEGSPKPKYFTFDWSGGPKTSQQDVFNYIGRQMIDACIAGYNGTIFAYGQTGAGKTYTMLGKHSDELDCLDEHRGLQPRCIEYLFYKFDQMRSIRPDTEVLVKCTYIEIYNEKCIDLVALAKPAGEWRLQQPAFARRLEAGRIFRRSPRRDSIKPQRNDGPSQERSEEQTHRINKYEHRKLAVPLSLLSLRADEDQRTGNVESEEVALSLR